MQPQYFKVTNKEGKSIHGGNFQYDLPNGVPTKWYECEGELSLCNNGFHLATILHEWIPNSDVKIFIAEYEGEVLTDTNKICCRKVRLVREATDSELWEQGVYFSGTHDLKNGKYLALGNSQVTAWENSQVTAWGNSQVTAWENSQVTAWENSQVTARGNSQVTAWENSQIRINDEYWKGNKSNIKINDFAFLTDISERKIYVKKSAYQIVEL